MVRSGSARNLEHAERELEAMRVRVRVAVALCREVRANGTVFSDQQTLARRVLEVLDVDEGEPDG